MTDLEMTRLCAEARELDWCGAKYSDGLHVFTGRGNYHKLYDPLHDDDKLDARLAESVALITSRKLAIECFAAREGQVVEI